MPDVLKEHGFSNVSVKNHEDPPFLRRWLTEVYVLLTPACSSHSEEMM
jgi:hypothetical protein